MPEPGGGTTLSCLLCHTNADMLGVNLIIDAWKSEYQSLDSTVSANVARAAAALQGVANPTLQAVLAEAQHNLHYAESDESGGFHNHGYVMALLQNANQKVLSLPLLTAAKQGASIVISWSGPGTLQAAGLPGGPWHDVSGATNPLTINLASQTQCQFYRLRP